MLLSGYVSGGTGRRSEAAGREAADQKHRMKNIKEWLSIIAIFIVLILPGIVALWKAIIFNIPSPAGVVVVCGALFVIGGVVILSSLDY